MDDVLSVKSEVCQNGIKLLILVCQRSDFGRKTSQKQTILRIGQGLLSRNLVLAALIIVVTIFTCHLSKLSGMCLHLAWTNISKFPAGPEQYFSLLLAANEEACLQVISQSETRRPFGGVPGFVF